MKNIANANIYLNYELNSNNLYNIDNIDNQKLISEQDVISKKQYFKVDEQDLYNNSTTIKLKYEHNNLVLEESLNNYIDETNQNKIVVENNNYLIKRLKNIDKDVIFNKLYDSINYYDDVQAKQLELNYYYIIQKQKINKNGNDVYRHKLL